MLQVLDNSWKEHLAAMDQLRQGIHLRGYAQKDPKQEYKREAFEMFNSLLNHIKSGSRDHSGESPSHVKRRLYRPSTNNARRRWKCILNMPRRIPRSKPSRKPILCWSRRKTANSRSSGMSKKSDVTILALAVREKNTNNVTVS